MTISRSTKNRQMMQGLMSSTENFIRQKTYLDLAEILKKILTLSPGQASAERGFSVIKTVLVNNLSVISLV